MMKASAAAMVACALVAACRASPPRTAGEAHARPVASSEHLEGYRFIAEDATRAEAAGASSPRIIAMDAGAPGDRVTRLVELPEAACALFIARAAASVEDADLFVYGDDGTVLGTDEAPDRDASLIVCPPHPVHVYVVARVAAGHGLVSVAAQSFPPDRAASVGREVGARGGAGETAVTPEAWPGLDEHVAEHRRSIGGMWRDLRRAAVPVDPRIVSRLSAPIDAAGCVDALVIPDDQVSHLDVTALDERGTILGRATTNGRDRGLVVCSPTKSVFTLEIRPHAGRGLAAVILSRSEGDVQADLRVETVRYDAAPIAPLDEALDDLEARLDALGLVEATKTVRQTARVGRRTSIEVPLDPGCHRLDVVAGKPTRGLRAWVWSEAGELIASAEHHAAPTLFLCQPGGTVRLDVEALTRGGPFAAVLHDDTGAGALAAHPLAAGRLIARLQSNGSIERVRQLGPPKHATFSPTHLTTHDLIVPVGRCVDVAAAVGSGATGVEIRLVDAKTNEELALQVGTHSTAARACALDRPETLAIRAEMRVAAGSAEGLYAARMSAPPP